MRYPAHAAFLAPATERSALWRLLLGCVIALIVFALTLGAMIGALVAVVGSDALPVWLGRLQEPDTPVATLMVLSTFIGMVLATLAAARVMHRRGLSSLIGQNGHVRADFIHSAGIAFAILILSLAWFLWREPVVPNIAPSLWLMLLPLALLALLIQTGAEELLFRGYLQQQLGARFASPLVWMLIPSLLFGFAHFDPAGMGTTAPLMLAAATLFGLLAADLTAKTGSIAAAWGFHFANNCLALLAVSVPGSISGLSLYLTPFRFEDTDVLLPMIAQDMAVTVLIWGAIRASLRRAS